MSEEIKKAITMNLVETMTTDQQLIDGLKAMPQNKMFDQIKYLQEHVLPQALTKMGEQSESYQFYKSLVDSLLWGIHIAGQFQHFMERYNRERYHAKLMHQQITALENELQKYATLNDVYMNMTLTDYQKILSKKAAEQLSSNT